MKLKRVAWRDSVAIGGALTGKSSDEKDFASIELDRARTTVALTPLKGDVVYLVPWVMAAAATCSVEDFTAPAKVDVKAK
jgi:hypothetical protein